VVFAVGQTASAQPSIVGHAHDFSTKGFAKGEICLPCHTPHNSVADETGAFVDPLCNHELTTATYTMFEGNTGDALNDFDQVSRMCMSCHDGTVALDSFGGTPGSIFIDTEHLIGTDLRNDHPVGSAAVYPLSGDADFRAAVNDRLGPNSELELEPLDVNGVTERVVSCNTCHTPHYKGFAEQLRMSNTASALCLSCHIK